MTFDYELFCKRLTELRKLRGLNKYEMSIQSNIQYQYYCDIENGESVPNFKNVISIANALKIDLDTLLNINTSTSYILKMDTVDNLQKLYYKELLNHCSEILLMLKTLKYEGDNND